MLPMYPSAEVRRLVIRMLPAGLMINEEGSTAVMAKTYSSLYFVAVEAPRGILSRLLLADILWCMHNPPGSDITVLEGFFDIRNGR